MCLLVRRCAVLRVCSAPMSAYQNMDTSPALGVRVTVQRAPGSDSPMAGGGDSFRRDLGGSTSDRMVSGGEDTVTRRRRKESETWRLSRVACGAWTLLSLGAVGVIFWLSMRVIQLQNDVNAMPTPLAPWQPPTQIVSVAAYEAARADLLARNFALSAARGQVLNEAEARVDAYLSATRSAWLNATQFFPTSHYFYSVRPLLEASPLFPHFQAMPKGAVLHIHTGSLGDTNYLIANLTHRPNCYVQLNASLGLYQLSYFEPGAATAGYVPIASARANDSSFDVNLYTALTMSAANSPCNRTSDQVFPLFDDIFGRLGLLRFPHAFVDYYTDGFEKLIANGVQYVEVRAGVSELTALNGTRLSIDYTLRLWEQMRTSLRARFASVGFDFNLILAYNRASGLGTVEEDLRRAFALKQQYPDLIIGFDLVSYEDAGHTTEFFAAAWVLHDSLQQSTGLALPLFFHAGESDEANTTDIVDALACNTRRIGHGFNLYHFPAAERVLIDRQIAIEVCPLSNQILGYVNDLRLHPAGGYLARGVPVVLSSDDPGIFGYVGMGYDYLVAYLAWGLDLRTVKQLLQNSLQYSTFTTETARTNAFAVLTNGWNQWIAGIDTHFAMAHALRR